MAGGLFSSTVNVTILAGAMAYYLRDPIRGFVRTRHTTLKDELQKVGEQLRGAQRKYDDFSAKLGSLEAEIRGIRDQFRSDAQTMKQKVAADAARLSQSIVTDARSTAEGVMGDLKRQLRTELGERVLERAEAILRERLTKEDRVRIVRDFSKQVEGTR